MPEIVTDQEILRKKSEPANDLEVGDIVQQLSISIPAHALGLAAPQIGIHKRIFLANLLLKGSSDIYSGGIRNAGQYAFVNPEITWTSPDKVPSQESCLSLPGIHRCVERHSQVSITCDKLINITTGDLEVEPEPIRLKGRDSVVVQHENDHLDGVLIINLPMTMTQEEKRRLKEKQRNERIEKARESKAEKFLKTLTPPTPQKLSAKNQVKKKREVQKKKTQQRTTKRQEKIRVETQERYKAEKDGLFSKDTSPVLDAEIKDDQD